MPPGPELVRRWERNRDRDQCWRRHRSGPPCRCHSPLPWKPVTPCAPGPRPEEPRARRAPNPSPPKILLTVSVMLMSPSINTQNAGEMTHGSVARHHLDGSCRSGPCQSRPTLTRPRPWLPAERRARCPACLARWLGPRNPGGRPSLPPPWELAMRGPRCPCRAVCVVAASRGGGGASIRRSAQLDRSDRLGWRHRLSRRCRRARRSRTSSAAACRGSGGVMLATSAIR